jgi:hypothetical protein
MTANLNAGSGLILFSQALTAPTFCARSAAEAQAEASKRLAAPL